MLEVCFNDSVKGGLKYAMNYKPGKKEAVSFFTDKKGFRAVIEKIIYKQIYRKRQAELDKIAVPLQGNKEDIVGISFGLWQGDISRDITRENLRRKENIKEIFVFDRYGREKDAEKQREKYWKSCISDLEKLKAGHSKIRIWLDSLPETQCGLLFVADLLKDTYTEIHVVELPREINRPDGAIVKYKGWGEVEPQLFGAFIHRERALTKGEIKELAKRWQQLKSENAPLRVMQNGQMVSAGIDYYDNLIRKEFPKTSCSVAEIIGLSLGRQMIPTSDVFIAKRIQHFIENKELIVNDSGDKGFYSAVVACNK